MLGRFTPAEDLSRIIHKFEASRTRPSGALRYARDRRRLITPEKDASGLPALFVWDLGLAGAGDRKARMRSRAKASGSNSGRPATGVRGADLDWSLE
jgi:hypothetical protein